MEHKEVAAQEVAKQPGQEVAEKVGIEALKKLLAFIMSLIQAVADAMADGKIGVFDFFKFLKVMVKAGPAFKNIKALRAEVADLSDNERDQLKQYIEAEFQIQNKTVEGYIEQALQAGISILDLIPVFAPVPMVEGKVEEK